MKVVRPLIFEYYKEMLTGTAPYCQPLTQEILDLLVENKIVLPESQSRIIKNEIEKKATAKKAEPKALPLYPN